MTAAIFFEGGLIQLLLGGAFLLFTRRFLGLVRILVVGLAGPLLYGTAEGLVDFTTG